jgi:tRNA A37 N6-isopentenylltransferase MiaA
MATTTKTLLTANEIYDLMSIVDDKLSFEEIEQLQYNPYDVFNINKSLTETEAKELYDELMKAKISVNS